MSRIELGGFGTRNTAEDPTEQLDPDTDYKFPITLALPHGSIFDPVFYLDGGYTDFEVTVIGAAGGAGAFYRSPPHYPVPLGDPVAYGGAGGGGGLHVVRGLLEDLPPEGVPVVVGRVGLDGTRYASTTDPYVAVVVNGSPLNFDTGQGHAQPYSEAGVPRPPYMSPDYAPGEVAHGPIYYPNPYIGAGIDGADGQASSFGDIAVASGGKGGIRATQLGPNYSAGQGGRGGIGGTDVAGGGGTPHPGTPDGTWDGTIGQGGGGGRGGTISESAFGGGRGSFSLSDTSRYGPGMVVDYSDPSWRMLGGAGGGATVQRRAPGSIYGGGTWTDPYQRMFIDSNNGDSFAQFTGVGDGFAETYDPNGFVTIHITQDV